MRRTIIGKIGIISCIALMFISCEETGEWYLGFHKQPKFFDGEEYSKVINVFGVIRPDVVDGGQQSFVRVEKTVSSKDIEFADSLTLTDAKVIVTYNDAHTGEQILNFDLSESDTSYIPDVFKNNNLEVIAGNTYRLECSSPGYDTVYASTIVPNKPVILSAAKNGNSIHIRVESGASAYLYEAVYFSYSSGYVKPESGETVITIEVGPGIPGGGVLQVFAYDKNLSDYFSDVTSSILNLNSYRAPYTSVDGGYGCFGSLNFVALVVE